MSQRLLISYTKNITKEDNFYDAMFTENLTDREKEKVMDEWVGRGEDFYLRPFKIMIKDIELWDDFYPFLKEYFRQLGEKIENIWMIYYKDMIIQHPTPKELRDFIKFVKEYEK